MYHYCSGTMLGLHLPGLLPSCVWWATSWVLVIVTEKTSCLIPPAETVSMWILTAYLTGCVDMHVLIKSLFIKHESVNIRSALLIKSHMWNTRMLCLCIGRDIWLARKGTIPFDPEPGGCSCELYSSVFSSCKITFKLIWF